MKKSILPALVIIALAGGIISCNDHAEKKESAQQLPAEDMVKKGEYLVGIMGCHDCHSPKRMGPNGPELIPELLLSGYPSTLKIPPADSNVVKTGWVLLWADLTTAVGPWGQSYAGNITSDSTGIGAWSEEQFRKAITEGKYKGLDNTRPLMPTMPWQNYRHIKDEDLKAIFAYLKSTRPVKNVVPEIKLNPLPAAAK